jgi:hypothetical protein
MPESPPVPVPPPPSGFRDHAESDWVPLQDLPWYRRWSRGWRLALLIVLLLAAYGLVRGPADYRALKKWRAQRWLAEAASASNPQARRAALRKAATLAPDDEAVVRALLDFGEATRDPVALEASQLLAGQGWERPEDVTRRVRVAVTWRGLDARMNALLEEWSKEDPAKLDAERLTVVAQWWAQEGKTAEAAGHLSKRLEGEPAGKIRTALQLQLARLYLQENSTLGPQGAPVPAWSLLAEIIGDEGIPEASRERASALLAASLRDPRRYPGVLPPADAAKFIGILDTAAGLPALPTRGKFEIDLTRTALQRFCTPASGEEEGRALASRWQDAAPDLRLEVVRWLNGEGLFAAALAQVKSAPPDPLPQGWLIAHLDALAGTGAWEQVAPLLAANPTDALSPLLRQLFIYRAAKVLAGPNPPRPENPLHAAQSALLRDAPAADPGEILYAAGNLEAAGDLAAALPLFRLIKDREGVAGPARRGIVRCLASDPERVKELISALESVVSNEPRLMEAQADLVYGRLMEGWAEAEDFQKAQELAKQFPQYLSCRTLAALAALKQTRPAEALAAYDGMTVDWKAVPVTWRLVRAAVLAANDRREEAQSLVTAIDLARLTPGARLLLRQVNPEQ